MAASAGSSFLGAVNSGFVDASSSSVERSVRCRAVLCPFLVGRGELSAFGSSGLLRYRGTDRPRGVLVVRASNDGYFLKNIGTQIFKVGGKKEKSSGVDPPASGTQIFKFGGKKKAQEPEEAEGGAKGGTQLFKFGSIKGAQSQTGSSGGTSLATRKESTNALDALSFGRGRRADPRTVFVAGATGQIGARISQQLLQAGFNVRGGVPELYVAQQLAEFATQYGVITRDEAKRVNAVEFDFKNAESIAKAIANSSKVVVTVGPTEDGPRSKVTTADALRVLEAAKLSNAGHFVLVSDSGTGVSADNGPLAGLSALFSSLFNRVTEISEADLIDKIVESDLTFTVVKAGSTDGVDDYATDTGNLVVEAEGASDPSSKVSKIQVASLVSGICSNAPLSENKVLEVSSSQFVPSRPTDELLGAIPVDGRRAALEEKRAQFEASAKEQKARAEAEAEAQKAAEEVRRASKLAAQLVAEAKKLADEEAKASAFAAKAQARAEAAAASVDGLAAKAKELGGFSFANFGGQKLSSNPPSNVSKQPKSAAKAAPAPTESPKPFFFLPKLTQQSKPSPVTTPAVAAQGASERKGFFGGLFAPQDTLYVDDD